jgi:hypothetical protein
VSLYGAERIVCGTDGSGFGCDWTRKALADVQIGEAARKQIPHRNAAAMLARGPGARTHGVRTAAGALRPALCRACGCVGG